MWFPRHGTAIAVAKERRCSHLPLNERSRQTAIAESKVAISDRSISSVLKPHRNGALDFLWYDLRYHPAPKRLISPCVLSGADSNKPHATGISLEGTAGKNDIRIINDQTSSQASIQWESVFIMALSNAAEIAA